MNFSMEIISESVAKVNEIWYNKTKRREVTAVVCNACPRRCGADRTRKTGVCGVGESFFAARAATHFWEEPCISGTKGSGTVFFSGCNLRCVFCQNFEVSHGCFGKEITDKQLCEIFDRLIAQGAHNLNLVNPTHYAERLARVLRDYRSPVPVVYNSSGYESVETLQKLEGLVDVYLPDFKFSRSDRAQKYAGAADYPSVAAAAIAEMKRQQPDDVFEGDLLKRGVIVRHLILPKNTNASVEVLQTIADRFGTKTIVSLMAQYTPCGEIDRFPELQRPITQREYDKVVAALADLGFENAYVQERTSADTQYIPPFDLTGIPN